VSTQAAADRGVKAEKLLNDELLTEAFANVRENLLANLEEWPLDDTAGAEKLRMMLKVISAVRKHLEKVLRDGKVAAHELELERRKELSPAEFRRDYLGP
jgi:hypothetical protein